MISYTPEMAIDLHFRVLNAIGISIKDNFLVDQDTGQRLSFEGKPLVYSYDINRPVFDTEDTAKLDLINNIKMANNLFGYYINKIKADPDSDIKEIYSFYQVDSTDGTQSALEIKMESEEAGRVQITSDPFCNNVLKYPALILLMEGDFYNVHQFDDPELAKKKGKK